jgi:sporulation protein YlmC with PRC-barrel domain
VSRKIHLERLLGKKVYDRDGRKAGRIEEVRARVSAEGCLVEAYLLGRAGLIARLSIPGLTQTVLGFAGAKGTATAKEVPWHQMDLSDPRRPKLRCTLEELNGRGSDRVR